jgi:citrate/tricarballylate utilization protein
VSPGATADFYAVVPHEVMVALFGSVALFVLVAVGIGGARFWRDMNFGLKPDATNTFRLKPEATDTVRLKPDTTGPSNVASGFSRKISALRDALTLRHLHGGGIDCTSDLDTRTPWRRWFHHSTFYGFMLCFASTSVAAVYHSVFGWYAPYDYTSLPVLLGTVGGVGLLVGPAGLAVMRRRRDPALNDAAQHGLDTSFLALLFLTSLTGLALLILRHQPVMPLLLIVHLGSVLALCLTLPYGKFVHGVYRVLALVTHHREGL